MDSAGYDGKQIALETSPETVMSPTITVSELTGSESILYLDFGGRELTAVVDARDYHNPGSTIDVAFNMTKAHFFDTETEQVIRKKSAQWF